MLLLICPCCSDSLLRHVSSQGVYWFCPSCYQSMPSYFEALDKHSKLAELAFAFPQEKTSVKVTLPRLVNHQFA